MNSVDNIWFKYASKNYAKEKINLFCFAHAGGSAQLYREWSDLIGEYINVYPIQLPMRENRYNDSMPDSINLILESFLKDNEELFNQEYIIFGHSIGAIMAMELAHMMEEKDNYRCKCLFVSGTSYPNYKKKDKPMEEGKIFKLLETLSGVGSELLDNELFMQYYMPIITADLNLFSNYEWSRGEKKLKTPVYLFGGKDDNSISVEGMLTWKNSSTNYIGETFFEGGHFYLKEHEKELLNIIQKVSNDANIV